MLHSDPLLPSQSFRDFTILVVVELNVEETPQLVTIW